MKNNRPNKPRERLKQARIAAGKSEHQVAAESGITSPNYYDLEAYDDEIYMTVTLLELSKICRSVNCTVPELFEGEAPSMLAVRCDDPKGGFPGLAQEIKDYLTSTGIDVPTYEERVGWAIADFLVRPSDAWNWNVDQLKDVANASGMNWLKILQTIDQLPLP
jgi:transcriptional regulator with XRE-family HTH domain